MRINTKEQKATHVQYIALLHPPMRTRLSKTENDAVVVLDCIIFGDVSVILSTTGNTKTITPGELTPILNKLYSC